MSRPEWLDNLAARYRTVREPAAQLCRPAFDERAAAASLYTPSGRLTVGPQNSAREVVASGRPAQGADSMDSNNLLDQRRLLIGACDDRTLRALAHYGQNPDRLIARAELTSREANGLGLPVTAAEDEAWDAALGEGRL